MSLFDKFKKSQKGERSPTPASVPSSKSQAVPLPGQPENVTQEPVFYEESGGVTKAQAIQLLQGAVFPPGQPIGVAGGDHDYGVVSYPGFAMIFFHQDKEHPMRLEKRAFMTREAILNDVTYYTSAGDFGAAAECVLEALEQNQGADEHWEVYCTAGEILWKLREIQSAHNLFLKASQCKDCDQKAHVLCQAAATSCILRDPNRGYALYHKALEEEPESLEARHDLGGFHWDMGELDQAAGYYFSVLKKDPSYYASYEELSNLFSQVGDSRWPKLFKDAFTKRSPMSQAQLAAAEKDMMALLEKSGRAGHQH